MERFAEYKVPGGKLIMVKLECGDRIARINVLGDFFLYPEEALHAIEESIVGMSKDATEKELSERIAAAASDSKAELIGVTSQAIAHAIRMAIG